MRSISASRRLALSSGVAAALSGAYTRIGWIAGSPITSAISAGRRVIVSHRRDSRVWSTQGTCEPGPPVTSGMSGGFSCAASTPTPAFVRIRLAPLTAAQPTATSAPAAAARPSVRRSSGVPPSVLAAPFATAPERADSPLATRNSSAVTPTPDASALGIETSRTTFSAASVSPGPRAPRVDEPGFVMAYPAAVAATAAATPAAWNPGLPRVGSSASAPTPARPAALRPTPPSRATARRELSCSRGGSAFITIAPSAAAVPSTTRPDTMRPRDDFDAMGRRSAVERRKECAETPQAYPTEAATPLTIAWSRVPRESRFGCSDRPV